MSSQRKHYYTVERNPESDEWDDCPVCEVDLRSKGVDKYRDDYDVYEFFVCDNGDCRVLEVVGRWPEKEQEEARGGGRL